MSCTKSVSLAFDYQIFDIRTETTFRVLAPPVLRRILRNQQQPPTSDLENVARTTRYQKKQKKKPNACHLKEIFGKNSMHEKGGNFYEILFRS